jgi:hypothetical protein
MGGRAEAIGLLSMPSPTLTRPIKPKHGAPLHTIDETCAYLISLPGQIATMHEWVCVAALALKACESPTEAAREELTRKLELALFLTHRLDLTVDRTVLDSLLERARE